MFNKQNARKIIAVAWIATLSILLSLYAAGMQPLRKNAMMHMESLEQSVADKDWGRAREEQAALKTLWAKNKIFVLLNNLTPNASRYEHQLNEVRDAVSHQNESSVEYVIELKSLFTSVTALFPTSEG